MLGLSAIKAKAPGCFFHGYAALVRGQPVRLKGPIKTGFYPR